MAGMRRFRIKRMDSDVPGVTALLGLVVTEVEQLYGALSVPKYRERLRLR